MLTLSETRLAYRRWVRAVPISLLICTLSAHAQGWIGVGTGSDMESFVDLTSIKPEGKYLKAWTRMIYSSPQYSNGKSFLSDKTLTYFDCKAGTAATKQGLTYKDLGGYGEVVYSWTMTEAQMRFDDPVPGSHGQKILDYVCLRR